MHALLDALARALRDAEQFDAEAEIFRRFDVGERDSFDALDVNRIGVDRRAERKRGQDRELMRGIEAPDIKGRIGFGITEALRLLQTLIERQLLALHARE